jgi:hypothetical protein
VADILLNRRLIACVVGTLVVMAACVSDGAGGAGSGELSSSSGASGTLPDATSSGSGGVSSGTLDAAGSDGVSQDAARVDGAGLPDALADGSTPIDATADALPMADAGLSGAVCKAGVTGVPEQVINCPSIGPIQTSPGGSPQSGLYRLTKKTDPFCASMTTHVGSAEVVREAGQVYMRYDLRTLFGGALQSKNVKVYRLDYPAGAGQRTEVCVEGTGDVNQGTLSYANGVLTLTFANGSGVPTQQETWEKQ